jgi:hypothetical protein
MTFLRNHQDAIAAMDFCIVPTVRFQLLYVWFVIDHGHRKLIHFNVTTNPSARWVIQQLREAFPVRSNNSEAEIGCLLEGLRSISGCILICTWLPRPRRD